MGRSKPPKAPTRPTNHGEMEALKARTGAIEATRLPTRSTSKVKTPNWPAAEVGRGDCAEVVKPADSQVDEVALEAEVGGRRRRSR